MTRYPAIFFIVIVLLSNITVHADDLLLTSVKADYILVEKAAKRMTLFDGDRIIRTYSIALGKNPEGAKVKKGDQRTPEGIYFIDSRNPESQYHLSLHISYPNESDRQIAAMAGVSSGGNIMIHGAGEKYAWMGKFHTEIDWTEGCIAVTNDEIEEIWRLVPDSTMIEIRP
jgi:murein L,D-transpeptidase YafK